MEPGVQTCEETLALRSGSCRDSAWLMVQVLRNLGLAARFVSGYLIQLKPDLKPLDGPPGPGSDFTDLHAWAEVYLPGAGWVGLDPTSGLLAGEGHLPLAATPNPDSAAPISGCVDPCDVDFSFQMSVTRVADAPRVTKPYTEEQWAAVEQLGHKVDARLDALDVRLTMGGEPTFVSIDDMEGPEWNMTADSPQKRRLAGTLLRRLSHCYGHGALLHFGQGKWYPGESLPRWALGCYWRKDGEPIWRKPELIAADGPDHRANATTALAFIKNLAERLHLPSDHVVPGYEDAWYYLWKERRLPANVDPLKSNLENEEDRKRLARIFERGLGQVVGYALPIRPIYSDGVTTRWESGRWFLRQENMFLSPGDSPMGLRLPLDSLPWYASDDTQPLAGARSAGTPRPAAFARQGRRRIATAMASRQATGRCRRRTLWGTRIWLVCRWGPRCSRRPCSNKCRALRRRRRPGSLASIAQSACAKPRSPSPRRSSRSPRRKPSARRFAWKPAKVACTSSCRRLPGWRTT